MFQQTIDILMGTNCAPPLADLFLHAYETDFLQGLLKNKDGKLAQTFNSNFRYIDDVLSLNYSRFGDLHLIYPNGLKVKYTIDTQKSASYLDLELYDKRDDFTFPIVNDPFISRNIPTSPAYRVYISQIIPYSRACAHYSDFSGKNSAADTRASQARRLCSYVVVSPRYN